MDRGDQAGTSDPDILLLPLLVGGDSLNPLAGFKFKREDVLGWIKTVVDRADAKSLKPIQIETIKGMAEWINDLALKGKKYHGEGASCGPSHHFSRKLATANPKKFDMVDKAWIKLQFRNLYDILGAFLMIVCQVPDRATKVNVFLPLTAMYAKWCSILGGHPDKKPWEIRRDAPERAGNWPSMFQCTWLTRDVKTEGSFPFRFCLGASLQGCDWNDRVPGVEQKWRERLVDVRLDMLRAGKIFDAKFDDSEPPKRLVDPQLLGNAPWGNCAESYPFTAIFREINEWQGVYGLALSKRFFSNCADDYSLPKIKGSLVGPCRNCQYLLKTRWSVEYIDLAENWKPENFLQS